MLGGRERYWQILNGSPGMREIQSIIESVADTDARS